MFHNLEIYNVMKLILFLKKAVCQYQHLAFINQNIINEKIIKNYQILSLLDCE